jgi:saccharopine dehydrogenase (NAD+, L-lysine-forming)
MTHIWLRAEPRAHETRVGLTPDGAAQMIAAGFAVTVEDSADRCIQSLDYEAAGCAIAPTGGWMPSSLASKNYPKTAQH